MRGRELPVKVKKQITAQLLFPHFDYVCVSFIDLNKDLESKLERQLNKAIRFIFNLSRRSSTDKFRYKLNWLSLAQRRQYFLLSLTFKVINFRTPKYLFDIVAPFIIKYDQFSGSQTRNRPYFSVPTKSSRSLDSSFGIAAMLAWNKLEPELRNIHDLDDFKSKIKLKLFNSK